MRLGAVIGVAPAATACSKAAGTSSVRNAISTPAGRPSTGREYPPPISSSPSECAAMAKVEPPVSNSANPSAWSQQRTSRPKPAGRSPRLLGHCPRRELSRRIAFSYGTSGLTTPYRFQESKLTGTWRYRSFWSRPGQIPRWRATLHNVRSSSLLLLAAALLLAAGIDRLEFIHFTDVASQAG